MCCDLVHIGKVKLSENDDTPTSSRGERIVGGFETSGTQLVEFEPNGVFSKFLFIAFAGKVGENLAQTAGRLFGQ